MFGFGGCGVLVKCAIVWVGRLDGVWLIVLLVLVRAIIGWFWLFVLVC